MLVRQGSKPAGKPGGVGSLVPAGEGTVGMSLFLEIGGSGDGKPQRRKPATGRNHKGKEKPLWVSSGTEDWSLCAG